VRRQDDLLEHPLLGQAVRLGLRGDLRLDERRAHVAGADRGRRDAVLGALEREHLDEAEQTVLGRDVRALERRRHEPVN
jgi:hypothetical protein